MNTPEPCCNCKHLYYDCMSDYTDCKLGCSFNRDCTRFELDSSYLPPKKSIMKLYIHKTNIAVSFTVAESVEEARNKIFDAKKKSWGPDGPHNTNPSWIKSYEAWKKEFEEEELMEFEIENFPTAIVELRDYDWIELELHKK